MITAIDDFGAGHSGLNMLADFRPDIVKIDMALIRGLDADPVRRAIVRSIVSLCEELAISVIAEGIETLEEAVTLRALGVRLFQGFLLARPAVEQMPTVPPSILASIRGAHEDAILDPKPAAAPRVRAAL